LLLRYLPACIRLIAQYKTMLKLVGSNVSSVDSEEFMTRCRVSTPLSQFTKPMMITFEAGSSRCTPSIEGRSSCNGRTWVAETTQVRRNNIEDYATSQSACILQSFITFMDALKLRMRAKDHLHPLLQELLTSLARFKGNKHWEGRSRLVGWFFCWIHVLGPNPSPG
jgi:ESCRT-I complex subunit VPS28